MSEFEVSKQTCDNNECMCDQYPMYGQYPTYGMNPWQDYQQYEYNRDCCCQRDRCPCCGRPYQEARCRDFDAANTDTDIDAENNDYHKESYDNYDDYDSYDEYGSYGNSNFNGYGYGYGYRYPYRGCRYPGCGYKFGFPFFNFPFRRRRRGFPFFF